MDWPGRNPCACTQFWTTPALNHLTHMLMRPTNEVHKAHKSWAEPIPRVPSSPSPWAWPWSRPRSRRRGGGGSRRGGAARLWWRSARGGRRRSGSTGGTAAPAPPWGVLVGEFAKSNGMWWIFLANQAADGIEKGWAAFLSGLHLGRRRMSCWSSSRKRPRSSKLFSLGWSWSTS